MKHKLITLLAVSFAVVNISAAVENGFTSLWDGKTFDGWKKSTENPDSWVIEDGVIVTRGPRSHLFYDGDLGPFKNFELKVDVMVEHNSNGGIYFHTKYQESGWPTAGFETQVNVSHKDWKKTGSVYGVASIGITPAQDKVWWTQHIIVEGKTVVVKINGITVVEYVEAPGAVASDRFERLLGEGTFALQCHDPVSVVRYKNIRVKKLP
jgi:hypothetical protein